MEDVLALQELGENYSETASFLPRRRRDQLRLRLLTFRWGQSPAFL